MYIHVYMYTDLSLSLYIYIYIYVYICMCIKTTPKRFPRGSLAARRAIDVCVGDLAFWKDHVI